MSWNAKVHWTEGLFLRPHHFQQNDRYLENALESRTRHVTPYPWGFAALEIDRDLAQQSKFALRRAAGIMPDGGLFDFPGECPPPAPITTPETAAGQLIWLTMPARADNFREVSPELTENAARYVVGAETVIEFHRKSAHRGGDRGRVSAPSLRDPQNLEAGLCQPADRAHRRGA